MSDDPTPTPRDTVTTAAELDAALKALERLSASALAGWENPSDRLEDTIAADRDAVRAAFARGSADAEALRAEVERLRTIEARWKDAVSDAADMRTRLDGVIAERDAYEADADVLRGRVVSLRAALAQTDEAVFECPDCYGVGHDACDACDGTGTRGRGRCRACRPVGSGEYPCPTCYGTGRVDESTHEAVSGHPAPEAATDWRAVAGEHVAAMSGDPYALDAMRRRAGLIPGVTPEAAPPTLTVTRERVTTGARVAHDLLMWTARVNGHGVAWEHMSGTDRAGWISYVRAILTALGVTVVDAEAGRCPECGGLGGGHSAVHVRHPQGGGGWNRPCSRAEVSRG